MEIPREETILAIHGAEQLVPASFVAEMGVSHPAEPVIGSIALELSQASTPANPWHEEQITEYTTANEQEPAKLSGEALLGLVALNASSSDDENGPAQIEASSLEKEEDYSDEDPIAESENQQSDDTPAEGKAAASDQQKSWSGGSRRIDCRGCGKRTKRPVCGDCDDNGKHAQKPEKRTRGDQHEKARLKIAQERLASTSIAKLVRIK